MEKQHQRGAETERLRNRRSELATEEIIQRNSLGPINPIETVPKGEVQQSDLTKKQKEPSKSAKG